MAKTIKSPTAVKAKTSKKNTVTAAKKAKTESKKVKADKKDLCKGKTTKGEPCTRKGVKEHDGYCFQHDPKIEKSKTVKKSTKNTVKKLNFASKSDSHPPYKIMISRALNACDDKKGTTLQAIKKYMSANYNIDPVEKAYMINRTLTSLVKSGEFVKNPKHLGHYRMSAEFRKRYNLTFPENSD